jgi:hypothetical protein
MKVGKACFNCDDSAVVAISTNGLFAWNAITGRPIGAHADAVFTDHCSALAVHPFLPAVVFIGCANGRAAIWDVFRGARIAVLQLEETFKISEAMWSWDGQAVVAADVGGFTVFRRTDSPFSTAEFFRLRDFDESDTSGDPTVFDRTFRAVVPQPPLPRLRNLRTAVVQPAVPLATARRERMILEKWRLSAVDAPVRSAREQPNK